jgi:hypothetical protein
MKMPEEKVIQPGINHQMKRTANIWRNLFKSHRLLAFIDHINDFILLKYQYYSNNGQF